MSSCLHTVTHPCIVQLCIAVDWVTAKLVTSVRLEHVASISTSTLSAFKVIYNLHIITF